MIDINQDTQSPATLFVLSPNCSMSWRQLKIFYAITCLLAIFIASFFYSQGLWMVIPFSGLEMLALGLALVITCRNSHRREVIKVDEKQISVEKGYDRPVVKWQFDRHWVQFRDEVKKGWSATRHITIGSHGNYIEVGDFLPCFEKDELAFQLKRCIIRR